MSRCLLVALVVASGCKAQLDDAGEASGDAAMPGGDSGQHDAASDAFVLGPWGTPAKVPGASTGASEDDATLSPSQLELVFAIADANDGNRKDLYVMTRQTTSDAFGAVSKLPFSATGTSEETPRFTPNGKTLYFASDRAGGAGGLDIWKVTRQTPGGAWSTPSVVAGPNTAANEKWLMPCAMSNDYLLIVGGDIGAGTMNAAAPAVVSELSAPNANETGTFLTGDCLTAYFASVRSGTNQIYTSHRTSTATAWEAPSPVTDFAGVGGAQEDPWLADDGRTFVFVSDVSGTKDVYISVR